AGGGRQTRPGGRRGAKAAGRRGATRRMQSRAGQGEARRDRRGAAKSWIVVAGGDGLERRGKHEGQDKSVCVWLAQAPNANAKFLLHAVRTMLHFGACPKAPYSAVIRSLVRVSRGGVAMSAPARAANLHTRIDARLMEVVRREADQ